MWYGIPDLSSLTRHQTYTPYSGREAITAGPPMELLKLNLDEEWWRWWWHNKTEVFIPKSHIFITWTNRKLYEGKRCLLVRRKTMTNLDSVLKSKDITLLTKVHIVKALVLPVVKQGCEKERKGKSLSRVWLFATPRTTQSMEFSRPEYWSE